MDNQNVEISREQMSTTLQDRLTNFLNSVLDQAGLLVDKAGEILNNLLPNGIPPLPVISLAKLKRLMQFRRKNIRSDKPRLLTHRSRQSAGQNSPFELLSQTISASNI